MHQLYTISFSHYCEKARWALDLSQERYREHGYAPMVHMLATLPRGGRSTPLMVTAEGTTLSDSSDILRYLDARAPGLLYPVDEPARAQVLALEDSIDEELGPHARRMVYWAIFQDGGPSLIATMLRSSLRGWQRRAAPLLARVGKPLIARGLKVDAAGAERSRAKVLTALDRLDATLSDGRAFLVGDHFSAADLTLATLLSPLVQPPEHPITGPARALVSGTPRLDALRDEFCARPSGAFALRLYRELRTAKASAA